MNEKLTPTAKKMILGYLPKIKVGNIYSETAERIFENRRDAIAYATAAAKKAEKHGWIQWDW